MGHALPAGVLPANRVLTPQQALTWSRSRSAAAAICHCASPSSTLPPLVDAPPPSLGFATSIIVPQAQVLVCPGLDLSSGKTGRNCLVLCRACLSLLVVGRRWQGNDWMSMGRPFTCDTSLKHVDMHAKSCKGRLPPHVEHKQRPTRDCGNDSYRRRRVCVCMHWGGVGCCKKDDMCFPRCWPRISCSPVMAARLGPHCQDEAAWAGCSGGPTPHVIM